MQVLFPAQQYDKAIVYFTQLNTRLERIPGNFITLVMKRHGAGDVEEAKIIANCKKMNALMYKDIANKWLEAGPKNKVG
jgi:hypothetical protein